MKTIKVNGLDKKIRLDIYLVKKLKQQRSFINRLINDGSVLVNNVSVSKNGILINNCDSITINQKEEIKHNGLKLTKLKLDILYEDNDLIVINKPKHIIVHPTSFEENNTIINALLKKIKIKDFSDPLRPGVVQRLDRNTTGLMVIVKNKKAYDSLTKQIQERILIRKYLAIVHNKFKDKLLVIKAPIGRSKQNLLKMTVSDEPSAKLATTNIEVIENYHHGALIECQLLTGRTHQIRVHLAYIHHPIYNDPLYGNYDGYKDYDQFLHAHYLSFIHPSSHKRLKFKSEPDSTFSGLIEKLKGK